LSAQQTYIVQKHTIGVEDGLLGNYATAVYQDSRSIMWIGTQYGLNSYNGIGIDAYTSAQNNLAGDYIKRILGDKHGYIWVLCLDQFGASKAQGISIVDPIEKTVIPLEKYIVETSNLNSKDVQLMTTSANGEIILCTDRNQVYKYTGDRLELLIDGKNQAWKYFDKDILIDDSIIVRTKQLENTTLVQFYDYKSNKNTEEFLFEGTGSYFNFYGKDSLENYYWGLSNWTAKLDSFSQSFYIKPPNQKSQYIQKHSFPSTINALFCNRAKIFQKLIFVHSNTLYRLDLSGNILQEIDRPDAHKFTTTQWLDNSGGIWYSDIESGHLCYEQYVPSKFKTIRHNYPNPSNIKYRSGVRGITLFKDSILAIGSGIGLSPNEEIDDLSIYNITGYSFGILNDGDSLLYLCKESGFLLKHNYIKNTTIDYFFSDSLGKTLLWTVYKDHQGTIWVGSSSGIGYLDHYKKQIVEPEEGYNEFEALRSSSIYHIHENEEGLWLCTSSGLYLWDYNKGAQIRYHTQSQEHSIPHNIILHLHEDKEGLFWLATKGGGLIKLDRASNQFEQFTMQADLANNVLYGMYEDAYNNLWFSSNWGITQFNKKTYLVNNYTKENGIVDNEFNTISHYQDKYGKIYFGSQDGITIIEPNTFQQTMAHYPLQIVSVQKLKSQTDEYIDITTTFNEENSLVLEPQDKGFRLQIALLDYRNPKIHKYAYKIEGINPDWHYQNDPIIGERNLPYGDYQIQIKVQSFDGHWIVLPEPVLLNVLRPFYLTWWFILLIALLGAILIFGIIRWRTQQLRTRQLELEDIVQQRTQKIAQQAEDLRALDKVKSRFFANISHELRTPLTLILGPASALLNKKEGKLDLEQKQGLKTIKNNGEHLLNLIEEILDLSKLEEDKLELEEEPIHLHSFVQNVFAAFEQQANYLDISYTSIYNVKGDLHVLLDSNKMEKVLNNLLSNALKFTPSGKQIYFIVNELEDELEILVDDNGVGIHPNDQPHIFERFYQSKHLDKPIQGGTGIGLALVKEFIKLMDGQVSVESELGKGTVFRLCIPKQEVKVALDVVNDAELLVQDLEEEEVPWEPKANQFTILLVEDHSEMRNFIASLLKPNYTLYSATDGLEGLSELKRNASNIDLIISDVMMPNMDGFAMLEQIKANEQWRMIPMIMLTARAADKDKLHALMIGVDDYLTKPFSVDELLIRIANLLENAQIRKTWLQEEDSPKLEEQETNLVSTEDLEWIQKIESLIMEEIGNTDFNVTALAKKLFISERQLRRRLKKITGLTPVKLLNEIRLKTAKQYLEERTKKSVTEVAFAVGFQSLEYFSRSFKKHFGKLPSAYLNK